MNALLVARRKGVGPYIEVIAGGRTKRIERDRLAKVVVSRDGEGERCTKLVPLFQR